VVGITTDYMSAEFESRYGQEFSLLHVFQTKSGPHLASYKMRTRVFFSPGVKRPRREADHSPPTTAEVRNIWMYTSTPPHVFTA
jgi:hypothetical protein